MIDEANDARHLDHGEHQLQHSRSTPRGRAARGVGPHACSACRSTAPARRPTSSTACAGTRARAAKLPAGRRAKRKLGSHTPRMIWEFHVFPHNTEDIELAREMAPELDMDIAVDKGWVDRRRTGTPSGECRLLLRRPPRCPVPSSGATPWSTTTAASRRAAAPSTARTTWEGRGAPEEPGAVTASGRCGTVRGSRWRAVSIRRDPIRTRPGAHLLQLPGDGHVRQLQASRAQAGTRSTFRIGFSANDLQLLLEPAPRAPRNATIDADAAPPARPAA